MRPIEIRTPRREEIPALKAIWQEAFPEDTKDQIGDFFRLGFAPERCLVLAVGGPPVSVVYWFDGIWGGGRFAYLYAVATEKAARGRGYSSRLIEAACTKLAGSGYAGALLVPAEPELFRFYGKLGFVPCCPGASRKDWELHGLTPLTAREYALRRQEYAAPGDALLTGPALDYFGTEGGFYAGPQGVLALAEPRNGDSFPAECLGAGPRAEKPEGGTPTAMFRALGPGVQAPSRFSMTLA